MFCVGWMLWDTGLKWMLAGLGEDVGGVSVFQVKTSCRCAGCFLVALDVARPGVVTAVVLSMDGYRFSFMLAGS
ncbi:hypothetical protein QQP08_025792 [Theobroma cacao]|nr:hypothetical protein QQP08_025792 [Theobroma cacao]